MEPKMYFLSNQQEDHYFEANSRQFQTGRPVHYQRYLSLTQISQYECQVQFTEIAELPSIFLQGMPI